MTPTTDGDDPQCNGDDCCDESATYDETVTVPGKGKGKPQSPSCPSKGNGSPSGRSKGKGNPSAPSKGKGSLSAPTVPDDPFDCVDENWDVAISDTMIITCSDIGYGKLCELFDASGMQGYDECCVCKNEPVPCPPSAPTPDSIESPTPSPTAAPVAGDLDNITKEPLVEGLIPGSISTDTDSSSAADTKKYGATFVAFILAALALV